MSTIHPDNVTHCMRCAESLERGYSSRWKGDECLEVICFDCNKRENLADHLKTGIINTNFMMECMMSAFDVLKDRFGREKYDVHNEDQLLEVILDKDVPEATKAKMRVQLATCRIGNKVKEFESKVWFKGLQDQVLATKTRGVSAKLGKKHKNFCVLTWTGMGRTMITIEDDDASVTCVADETSKDSRTGFHGIRATGEQAIALYDKAIALYQDGTLKFKDDEKVSMF
jgi:hypothetical protein